MTAELSAVFGLAPAEALGYLVAKGFHTTWSFDELLGAAHQRAFTVAGILKADALAAIRDSLVKAMADGHTYAQWLAAIEPELEKRGLLGRHKLVNPDTGEVKTLAPWRLRTIYHTNMQGAMMAGRYVEMQAASETHPYWQYVAILDSRTRPGHRALNGRTFRHDDPAWGAGFYPPLGYNCRCRVKPLTARALKRQDIALSESAGHLTSVAVPIGRGATARTATAARLELAPGEVVTTDPGFDHSPADAPIWLAAELQRRMGE